MKKTAMLQILAVFVMVVLTTFVLPVSVEADRGDRHERLQSRINDVRERVHEVRERIEHRFEEEDTDHDDGGHGDDGDHDDGGHDDGGGHGDGGHGDGHGAPVEAAEPIPTIDLIVHEDPKSGYNLEIVTTNYTLTPLSASTEHIDGEGHMHIYVDGEKITRVYGNFFYLKAFDEPGHHTVRVELSANDHRTYAHDGVIIDDTEMIIVE